MTCKEEKGGVGKWLPRFTVVTLDLMRSTITKQSKQAIGARTGTSAG